MKEEIVPILSFNTVSNFSSYFQNLNDFLYETTHYWYLSGRWAKISAIIMFIASALAFQLIWKTLIFLGDVM